MTDAEQNLGRRWFEEVWNKARREAIAEMLAPQAVLHDGGTDSTGPDGFYPFFDRIRITFPDVHVTVQDSFAGGDKICVRWSCTGTHRGDGLGVAATGKAMHVTGILIVRISNGMVIEAWQNWDMLGMLEQIQGAGKSAAYIAAS